MQALANSSAIKRMHGNNKSKGILMRLFHVFQRCDDNVATTLLREWPLFFKHLEENYNVFFAIDNSLFYKVLD